MWYSQSAIEFLFSSNLYGFLHCLLCGIIICMLCCYSPYSLPSSIQNFDYLHLVTPPPQTTFFPNYLLPLTSVVQGSSDMASFPGSTQQLRNIWLTCQLQVADKQQWGGSGYWCNDVIDSDGLDACQMRQLNLNSEHRLIKERVSTSDGS